MGEPVFVGGERIHAVSLGVGGRIDVRVLYDIVWT